MVIVSPILGLILEIDRALRESEGRLTVLIFTENDHPIGQLKLWFDDVAVRVRLEFMLREGFIMGKQSPRQRLIYHEWKFEVLTRLLEVNGEHNGT